MIYTEAENKIWWDQMPEYDKQALFDTIIEKARSEYVVEWAKELVAIWERGSTPTAQELAKLRKWV